MNRQPTGTRSIPRSPCRAGVFACGALLLVAPAFSETGARDPHLSKLPFEKWLSENRPPQIHWSVFIAPADLSTHQRLIQRITVRVDGKEIEKRRNGGEFLGLIEYRDAAGHVWQNHISVDPPKMQAAMQRQYLDITFYAFVLPGDYTIALGVCDPKTLEHSVTLRKIHVSPLKNDPLPDSWAGLPPVDLISGDLEPPDVWFLPEIRTRLNLSLESKRPLHIQLLLNSTPTGKTEGSASAVRENMSVLIPAMKILSQVHVAQGTIDAAMLDLTRRQTAFGQRDMDSLDWDMLRKFFLVNNPGIIDVHTLAGRMKMLGFFRDEITRRLASKGDGAVQVVIVLSGPAFFEDQEPVEPGMAASDPGRQLIYIRYRTAQPVRRLPPGARPIGRGGRFPSATLPPPNPEVLIPAMKEDDLEKTTEPLNARIFDAASSHQFRRILGAVVDQLSKL